MRYVRSRTLLPFILHRENSCRALFMRCSTEKAVIDKYRISEDIQAVTGTLSYLKGKEYHTVDFPHLPDVLL